MKLIVIGLSVLSIVLILLGLLLPYKFKQSDDWLASFIVGAIMAVVLLITVPLLYTGSVAKVAELRAFYEASQSNYAYAVEESESVLTIDSNLVEGYLIGVEGSVEKIDVGKSVTQLIAEYRDAVNEYNAELARIRALDSNFLTWVEYATPDPSLKFIRVT